MLAVIAQHGSPAAQIGGQGLEDRRFHLAGQKTGVDQPVQIELFFRQIGLHAFRRMIDIGRPNGFVRVLRIFPALILIGLLRAVFISELRLDKAPGGGHCFFGHADAVGTDVGHQTDGSRLAEVDAFVKLLHHLHGLGS